MSLTTVFFIGMERYFGIYLTSVPYISLLTTVSYILSKYGDATASLYNFSPPQRKYS
jgi:hypothetical protein